MIPVLLGPTGSGKTAMISKLDPDVFEIVSCDSRQIYARTQIGSAAPSLELRKRLKHHLILFLSPDKTFTAGEFVKLANHAIDDITGRNKVPVICGGTGFYFRALTGGLFASAPDMQLRDHLQTLTKEEKLILLKDLDPAALMENGGKIHPNDDYRITRAIEVTKTTGIPFSQHWKNRLDTLQNHQESDLHNTDTGEGKRFAAFYLQPEPELHDKNLRLRVEQMILDGMAKEAESIFLEYGDCPAMKTLGYRECLSYLKNEISKEKLVELVYISHRQYARRQRIWFQKERDFIRISQQTEEKFLQFCKKCGQTGGSSV